MHPEYHAAFFQNKDDSVSVNCQVTSWGTNFMRECGFASMVVKICNGRLWSRFSSEIEPGFVYAASIAVDGKGHLPALLNVGEDNAAEVSACGIVTNGRNTSHSPRHPMLATESDYHHLFGQASKDGLGKVVEQAIQF